MQVQRPPTPLQFEGSFTPSPLAFTSPSFRYSGSYSSEGFPFPTTHLVPAYSNASRWSSSSSSCSSSAASSTVSLALPPSSTYSSAPTSSELDAPTKPFPSPRSTPATPAEDVYSRQKHAGSTPGNAPPLPFAPLASTSRVRRRQRTASGLHKMSRAGRASIDSQRTVVGSSAMSGTEDEGEASSEAESESQDDDDAGEEPDYDWTADEEMRRRREEEKEGGWNSFRRKEIQCSPPPTTRRTFGLGFAMSASSAAKSPSTGGTQ